MNAVFRYAILIALCVLTPAAAMAQGLEKLTAAEAALDQAWSELPIGFRKVALVNEASGFGIYDERKDGVFKSGEPVTAYAEPVGYGWKDNGDGTYSFGFAIDLMVKTPDGKIVAGQEDFQRLELKSRARNKEFMLTLTLNLTGAPPGDYIIEYVTRDLTSSKSGKISLPITIAP
jgi:hypothetical protein